MIGEFLGGVMVGVAIFAVLVLVGAFWFMEIYARLHEPQTTPATPVRQKVSAVEKKHVEIQSVPATPVERVARARKEGRPFVIKKNERYRAESMGMIDDWNE